LEFQELVSHSSELRIIAAELRGGEGKAEGISASLGE